MISAMISGDSVWGGMVMVASPECTPASSTCSNIPPMKTSVPSATMSTSISMAWERYLSTRMGCFFDTLTAVATYVRSSSSL